MAHTKTEEFSSTVPKKHKSWTELARLKRDPLQTLKILQSLTMPEKNWKGDPSVSSGFANARKSFWLKQGLETATTGFP